MTATVIVATCNRARTLQTTLDSLAAQRVPDGFTWELLVVDNNSTDGTRAVIEAFVTAHPRRIRYLFEPQQGKTFALNTAIARARGRVLCFTDDDVRLDPHWLARMVGAMQEHGCAAAGGRILPEWTQPRPAWLETTGPRRLGSVIVSMDLGDAFRWFADTDTLPLGASLAITAGALQRVGPFRTDLGPTSGSLIRGEDSDICRRLLAAGEQLLYVPDAIALHPVDDRRLTRAYFERYYFDQGRALTREEGLPPGAICWFDVPRYFIAGAGRKLAAWLLARGVKRRFYHKLQFYYAAGRIVEARALRRAAAPSRVEPAITAS